jgi:tRNA G10  N-methylase Trm11
MGSYPPELSLTSADLTSTAMTIMVPFAGTGAAARRVES